MAGGETDGFERFVIQGIGDGYVKLAILQVKREELTGAHEAGGKSLKLRRNRRELRAVDDRDVEKLAQGFEEVALGQRAKIDEQPPQTIWSLFLELESAIELFRRELAGLDQQFAEHLVRDGWVGYGHCSALHSVFELHYARYSMPFRHFALAQYSTTLSFRRKAVRSMELARKASSNCLSH